MGSQCLLELMRLVDGRVADWWLERLRDQLWGFCSPLIDLTPHAADPVMYSRNSMHFVLFVMPTVMAGVT